MSKRLAITLIIILLLLNLTFAGFIFYKFKTSVNGLTASADSAASSTANSTSVANLLKLTVGKIEMPKVDVSGQDPVGIIRHRGDIRSGYLQNSNGTTAIEYKTTTAKNVVLSYYRTQLAKNNWIFQNATSDQIIFSKEGRVATISASTSSNGITTYTVNL